MIIFSKKFYATFEKGFSYYISGDWEKAKEYLEETIV